MNGRTNIKQFSETHPQTIWQLAFAIFLFLNVSVFAQPKALDNLETSAKWTLVASDQVQIDTATVAGRQGKALRIDFNFLAGSGYCGISKILPMQLPPNNRFTFYLKAETPVNSLEFKLVDSSGENVWWNIRRNYQFPQDWQKVVIKKRHITFAWGPASDHSLKQFESIQYFISSATGGRGSIYLDNFSFEELQVPPAQLQQPRITVSSSQGSRFTQNELFDGKAETGWHSQAQPVQQTLLLDFQQPTEIGGLILDWDEVDFPVKYLLLGSDDRHNWKPVYMVFCGKGGRAYLALKDCEYRYLKLDLRRSSRNAGYRMNDISLQDYHFAEKPETLFSQVAADHPRGYFPRYLLNEQTYWTVIGAPADRKEALQNEDGMVEVDKQQFSIEPFLFQNGKFLTRNNMEISHELAQGYLPIPTVQCRSSRVEMRVEAFADGPADSSLLYLSYTVKNPTSTPIAGNLYLAVRPFQVNPPWQFLNFPGGIALIHRIQFRSGKILINDRKTIIPLTEGAQFGAVEFDQGEISDYISRNSFPGLQEVRDHVGYASAALKYPYTLAARAEKQFIVAVPFYYKQIMPATAPHVSERRRAVANCWEAKLNRVKFRLPPGAARRFGLAGLHSLRNSPGRYVHLSWAEKACPPTAEIFLCRPASCWLERLSGSGAEGAAHTRFYRRYAAHLGRIGFYQRRTRFVCLRG
ncbi:hypothetical protein B1H10_00980 [candidate division KSB1 bacterium 4484_188]|nr:MAG: hypothetical protein B1H10_00980 [candidate division KSB1 bacterium 4484_188]